MTGATTPMPGSIICAVDGSEPAKGAIRVARDLSALLGRRLVFVRIVEPGTPPERIDAIAARLRELADNENHWGNGSALWLVDVGHPADRLVAAAEDEQASLVVLGSHGPLSSLLGSTSAEVSRRAPCPVVVVPPAANAAANGTDDRQFAGGIARLKTRRRRTDFAGGIARFRPRLARVRRMTWPTTPDGAGKGRLAPTFWGGRSSKAPPSTPTWARVTTATAVRRLCSHACC